MRKRVALGGVVMVLSLLSGQSEGAAAAEALKVCQFYAGNPLCKTVQEKNCVKAGMGIEAEHCTTTTEYWYWS